VDGGVVRRHAIVRTDVPTKIGDDGRAALRSLGIRTAIDLREPVERRLDPADVDGLPIQLHEHRIIGDGFIHTHRARSMSLGGIYRHLLEERGDRLTGALRLLARPDTGPALVFCSAGKDRTGLVSGLTLAALGATDEAIIADYTATERNMHGAFRDALLRRARQAGIDEQQVAVKIGAPPELMREVLDWLRERHGSASAFLRAHGMTEDELATLRTKLIAPSRAQAA
jgi:protein-tyrosine phosphatase